MFSRRPCVSRMKCLLVGSYVGQHRSLRRTAAAFDYAPSPMTLRALSPLSVVLPLLLCGSAAFADIEIRKNKNGSSWGSASNCCGDHGSKRTVAAVLVFFSDYF